MRTTTKHSPRRKAPVKPVHPVKAAHDKYMNAFANHAATPSKRTAAASESAQVAYANVNNMNMGGVPG